jgi:hypothetical protein
MIADVHSGLKIGGKAAELDEIGRDRPPPPSGCDRLPLIRKGSPVNYSRIALAAVGGFVAYFVLGGLSFALFPSLASEFKKYPAVYRPQDGMKKVMPAGMAAMLVGMVALAAMYAMLYRGGSGLAEGARFGALIGVFSVCTFVVHNNVNLNIGLRLTLEQAAAYFIGGTLTGIAIGLIYRPH